MSHIKTAQTENPVLDLIKNRWSARSFTGAPVAEADLKTIVEAASWSFSANNEQPWRFIVAKNDSPDFTKVLNGLNPANQSWAKNAGALIVNVAKTNFDKEGNPHNNFSEHDLGAATAILSLQAMSMGIHAHPMAGFDASKIKTEFNLGEFFKPVTVVALGYIDSAEKLEEPFKSRELTARTRKSLKDLILNHG